MEEGGARLGLVAAIAFESLIKLIALIILGAVAIYAVFGDLAGLRLVNCFSLEEVAELVTGDLTSPYARRAFPKPAFRLSLRPLMQ